VNANIRESITKLRAGDTLAVARRHQADYVLALAKETGHILKRQAESEGAVTLHCIGVEQGSALAWLKRCRTHRAAKRKWRVKNGDKEQYLRKLRECGIADGHNSSLF
jgi:hypothetical protein